MLDGVQIRLGYAKPGGPPTERTVHPLGLAAKQGHWYLMARTARGPRTFRVARVISVTPTGEPVTRPPDFDLATAWHEVTDRMAERMRGSVVQGRADPTAERLPRRLLDGRLRLGPAGPDGWLEMTVEGPSVQVVAAQLAGLGSRVEILKPPEARRRLAELAAELASVYGTLEPDAHAAGTPPAR